MGADLLAVIERLLDDRPAFHVAGGRDVSSFATRGMLTRLAREVRAGQRTLETGCGASTVVFAAAGTEHTAISPMKVEHDRIAEYCESIGVDLRRVRFVAEPSDAVLPALDPEEQYDVVMIDGAHSFPYAIVDWHYLRSHMRDGGLLLLDDVPIPAIGLLYRFIADDPSWRVESIIDRRAAVARKLADEPRTDEWQAQPFNARYPDYAFLPARERAVIAAHAFEHRVRDRLARRFPVLRRLTRRG